MESQDVASIVCRALMSGAAQPRSSMPHMSGAAKKYVEGASRDSR